MWILHWLVGMVVADIVISSKILGIIPTPSYSHQVVFQALWRELSLRGHQVTTITTHPLKDPALTNLTEIDLHFSTELWKKGVAENIFDYKSNPIGSLIKMMSSVFEIQEQQMRHEGVRQLLESEQEFDLAIIEAHATVSHAFVARFNCPHIGMLSYDAPGWLYETIGNPTHPVLYPHDFFDFYEHLPFLQRITSVISDAAFKLMIWYSYPYLDQLVRQYFGPNYPPLKSIMDNTSMLFVNTDPVFYKVRPLMPVVIQIGSGTHIQAPRPLPKELKVMLDNATNGFIYFALGSNVESRGIPLETRRVIIETFSELPYTVLWKFESDLPNKPENVFTSKWIPQQDVLRHPNIKLFITQGGMQSSEEALYSGVPIIGMPFFGDQFGNIGKMVHMGMGLSVDFENLNKGEFKSKILEVIQNPMYRTNVEKVANLARDQPLTGLERAVWWSEYVIRHKGAKHLRSPMLDVPWYQYLLLDVLGVLLLCLGLSLFIAYKFTKGVFRLVFRRFVNYKKKIQ
ncbi:hypothetical protein PPYR_14703 [Photinus pyralis]|uniref:UDP-glucuronosyltransferase n=1 Tax=Photinus pyralis TaxID=7054 RepID=A0A1Y1K2D9_PHOPY|nr:UDP-glucuronosyltransferase 2B33-like [Photinus pyralis]XP_031355630.1 UDP-glucuronosyltransferase 2B33-like [Photinus pyralis]XP_031355631.1 UDP-glucuronosyltransferase 2B33-like [Photinus pyralis]KAB0792744.1 hypothetical protein PPYR_14703 [Photinus pyralis]